MGVVCERTTKQEDIIWDATIFSHCTTRAVIAETINYNVRDSKSKKPERNPKVGNNKINISTNDIQHEKLFYPNCPP